MINARRRKRRGKERTEGNSNGDDGRKVQSFVPGVSLDKALDGKGLHEREHLSEWSSRRRRKDLHAQPE